MTINGNLEAFRRACEEYRKENCSVEDVYEALTGNKLESRVPEPAAQHTGDKNCRGDNCHFVPCNCSCHREPVKPHKHLWEAVNGTPDTKKYHCECNAELIIELRDGVMTETIYVS